MKPADARSSILDSIRRNLARSAPHDAPVAPGPQVRQSIHLGDTRPAAAGDSAVSSAGRVQRFRDELVAVGGRCLVVPNRREAGSSVNGILVGAEARRVAVSDVAAARDLVASVPVDAERIVEPTPAELFECDVGISSAQWGIAETGTLVLESESERHRLISLVPPIHIAVIDAAQIRSTLGEVLVELRPPGRPVEPTITFITGPSRTADIELTLAIGVHGPRDLYVIVCVE